MLSWADFEWKDYKILGRILGRIASDGSVDNRGFSFTVAEHELPVLHYIQKYLPFNGNCTVINKKRIIDGLNSQEIYSLRVNSVRLFTELDYWGIKNKIPTFVWKNRDLLSGYLSGLFDSDGTVNNDNIVLVFGGDIDKKEVWAREVVFALQCFGIRSRIRKYLDEKNGNRVVVSVNKRDCSSFAKTIGFINPIKQKKAENIKVSHKYKIGINAVYGECERVRSVEQVGISDMYDVINSESSRFVVNGFISHNCNAVSTKRAMKLIHSKLIEKGLDSECYMTLPVHDEIIAESPDKHAEEVREIVQWGMESAGQEYLKKVKVVAEAAVCETWADKS